MKNSLRIIPFTSSDSDFQILYELEKSLDYHVENFGSVEMLNRHPFPGPGLGVRILGEITKEKANVLKEADHIFIQELIKADLYNKVSQAFAVYLPIKSVGVVGDERRYAEVIGLRAVETVDFMTARWAHLPYEFLEHVSNRIVNEIEEVSRVVYDISSKPPATIEWE